MMGELQVVDIRTPIEIALDIDSEGMTTARKLYEFLELDSRNYSSGARETSLKMNLRKKMLIIGCSSLRKNGILIQTRQQTIV